jgi:hypothetical protein
MARNPHDTKTQDLLAWTPPEPVKAFAPVTVRAASFKGKMAKAVSQALKDCPLPREEIAEEMTRYSGEHVSKDMLDKWASEAAEDHVIPLTKLDALIEVTRDQRLLQILSAPRHWSVIDDRYLPAIDYAMLAEKAEELEKRRKAAAAAMRAGGLS